ncbi:hypothetical protein [Arthrobacter sp. ISL-5]|uniref:hypothetical protein n=1 Tax=Arthrobacter sp. ISL-5 TaxID=2819111 RepID=UPI001BED03EA|nr:hypothetical protein [Arthrobacter sp. ISL-5]MBT2554481.1 hypothetical protein [Arthrobacter sp. ISL-5]
METICSRLTSELNSDDDELARLRSIRARTSAAKTDLEEQGHLVWRLARSGFVVTDIPKVLSALRAGAGIDLDIMAELLQNPGPHDPDICADMLAPEGPSLSDHLSLLYVTGKHHGIEPDYQLALGQMPAEEVVELRKLCKANFPPRRFAKILAVAETTKLAIRAKAATSLSVGEYAATAEPLARRFRGHIFDDTAAWPAPVSALTWRLGGGSWDQALRVVGLQLRKAADRFGEDDFTRAIHDYAEECADRDFPLSLETYDRWVTAEVSRGGDRPSAIEMTGHYGGWQEALSTLPGHEAKRGLPGSDSGWYDPALIDRTDPALEAAWLRAGEYICELLANMPRNRSLRIHYGDSVGGSVPPYAEGTRGVDGVWCEVVSTHLLPSEQWPIDAGYFKARDWLVPDDEIPHWCKENVAFQDAGHQLLKGLRFGRLCPDPWQLRWSTKELTSGPIRDHGVTMEQALAGDIQTLRNAG